MNIKFRELSDKYPFYLLVRLYYSGCPPGTVTCRRCEYRACEMNDGRRRISRHRWIFSCNETILASFVNATMRYVATCCVSSSTSAHQLSLSSPLLRVLAAVVAPLTLGSIGDRTGAVLGKEVGGHGPSSFGRQQRLSEITIEPVTSNMWKS